MRVVVIGGTGHVGSYLVPRLVAAGHAVTVISRANRKPYFAHGAWQAVQRVALDRATEEAAGAFGAKIRALEPEAVIDMICYEPESARQLVEALRGQVQRFLHCSTCWVHGQTTRVPVGEDQPRRPLGEYGRKKAAIEAYLLEEARRGAFPAACILPGHIVGPGWAPLNPAGNFNPQVFARLARGEPLALPNRGAEIVHHVHADDVAQLFMLALENWNAACGESFHAVSPQALTLRGYAEAVASWFGQPARLEFLPWEAWRATVPPEDAHWTWEHLEHSPNCYSLAKARSWLGYAPRYTSLEAVYEAVQGLVASGVLEVG